MLAVVGALAALSSFFATRASAEIVGEPSGGGPFPAVVETRPELPEHTIYRPAEWPDEPLPLYVWGNGGCGNNGLAHASYLYHIASHGYVVVALGVPGGGPPPPADGSRDATQASQMLEAIDWATRETARKGGDFSGRIDVSRVAVGGHSCGGLQALAVSHDPRVDTTLVLNSGIYITPGSGRSRVEIDKSQLARLHAPALYLSGGPSDIAHENARDDVARIDRVPVFFGALPVGHGGTFSAPGGGEWGRVSLRWLDWHLKDDADASWDFAGASCRLCADERWSVQQKQMPPPTGPFRESLYVSVRDGTLLAMNILRPAENGVLLDGPHPVIFSFTPYRARYRTGNGRVVGPRVAGAADEALLAAGYVLAVADIRGKGASFGSRRGFQDRTEALDGYDLVQWLAKQPWSNGKVGMFGCSYLGGTAVHVATAAPPALRAIFAGATDLDKFAFVRKGGVTAQFNTRPDEPLSDDLASVPVDADHDGSLLRAAVAEHARNTPMALLWYGMPFRDSVSELTGNRFWEEVGPYTYLETLRESGIATYFFSNWRDEPTAQVILAAENLGSRLLLGPGLHCVTPPDFDFTGELLRFFDEHLRDKAPDDPAPRVTWWLNGAPPGENWRHDDRWPGVRAPAETWYLAEGENGERALRADSANAARTTFTVNYDVATDEYFLLWIDSQHGRGLSFTSPPFSRPHTLIGYPVVHLKIASDQPEPILFAYLETLAPDGTASVIAVGRLAAAYRKTGEAPYDTLGLPWHTGLEADYAPLAAGEEAVLSFALTPTSEVIDAGYRLRLVVTGADPRQRNLEDVRIDPPPNITLILGGADGSRVELPLAVY
ncbi:MAG: CocE/NonD family hydrolase [Gammaproteobacteria bacterium]